MAVDTRNKRGSAIAFGLAIILPLADGVIDQADRQQTAHTYSGILAESPSLPSPFEVTIIAKAALLSNVTATGFISKNITATASL